MSAPLLAIEGLGLTIGGRTILHAIDLRVEAGRVLGLVGESGSGKSLTALAIMRLLPAGSAAQGAILFEGRDLMALDERAMCAIRGQAIGFVFQEPMTALNPLLTIGAQVAEGIALHQGCTRAEALAQASAVLAQVGLPAGRVPADRFPHELSGGQRQRVVIAMAVALKPRLIIADEPTSALDVTTQSEILALLQGLVAENGSGLLLISHDLALVAARADRIAVMRQGRIVEAGPAARFPEGFGSPYTRALIAAATAVPARPARQPPGAPVLQLDDLTRIYRCRRLLFGASAPVRAVDGVSLAIRAGESLGLVGESGCGKSTLARLALGLEPPQAGRVRVDGVDLAGLSGGALLAMRRRVQAVFQDPSGSFDPRHKAGRLVAEPLHLLGRRLDAGERTQLVQAALAEVGLDSADAEKYPHEFSGGQRQRLAIARALITRPALIVLDEPVSALDVSIRAQILALLARLQDELGLAYLFITHDLGVVRAIADRVAVMREGRILEEGPTPAVLDHPRHAYTRSLIAATPMLRREDDPRARP